MHITALCPSCRNTYQVDPGLQGMRMRCPNASCRQVFVVQDLEQVSSKTGRYTELYPEAAPIEEEPRPPENGDLPQDKPPAAGSVEEFVPVLEAEVVREIPPSETKPPAGKTGTPRRDAVPTLPAEIVGEQKPDRSAHGPARSW